MRTIGCLLAVALLGAASPAPSGAAPDHLAGLLGTWTCRDGANELSTLTFRRDGDAIVSTDLRAGADASAITLRYGFDTATGRWHVTRLGDQLFSGSAPPWNEAAWDVQVTQRYGGGRADTAQQTVRFARDGDGPLYWGAPNDAAPHRVSGRICVLGTAPPDAAICPAADVPARALRAAQPGPSNGRGDVRVLVSLDADSHIVSTRIADTTNVDLNRIAEDAARRSTYRTAYHDCRPVPSTYIFSMAAM